MRLRRSRRQTDESVGSLADGTVLRAAYDDHGGELFALAYRSLGDRGRAEEAVQETFLRAWRGADRYDPRRSTVRTWLYAICRNVVIDASRALAARPRLADAEPPDLPTAERPLEQLLVGLQMEEALRRLSDQHRFVLVEIHLRDRPAAEVAAQLGIPVGTVRSRVYYGLKALRLVLEEMGWHGDQ
ncbi:sigma-70 family RNA polymerase sigma factor [Rhodococcus sp. TAF43]|uniref:sigma-70 family RNA polymerase sigma factor n=1 Tax=unclassified Rhodococcus (in: high G+C Gram-positive bacteria) TaxID=192944 RepID=UPI000E0B1477|nr:sigma-70 family RNA polymerase sigma factor [Rhodococcus sp. AG1013]RDI30235.1 RNA polymerase sigma-70 factor (ECF subfamily) [Rhodococcus sp. AG1013]